MNPHTPEPVFWTPPPIKVWLAVILFLHPPPIEDKVPEFVCPEPICRVVLPEIVPVTLMDLDDDR